jgi:glucuronoarabinoxylan endo-1,4-beta-xylanase
MRKSLSMLVLIAALCLVPVMVLHAQVQVPIETLEKLIASLESVLADLKALVPPVSPPPPINCELSDPVFEGATEWSTCTAEGTQTRHETWARVVTVFPENGGTACPENLVEVRTVSQTCTPPPPPPPPSSQSHDYFNALVKSAQHAASYDLRNQAQLVQYSQKRSDGTQDVNYVWSSDTDPRKQDAAKLIIPSDGTTVKSSSNQNSILQVRVPMPAMELGHSYLVTWDGWYGAEWEYARHEIASHKAFQFDGPDRPGGAAKIWMEINHGYQGNKVVPVGPDEVAHTRMRHYAISIRQSSSGTWFGVPAGPNVATGSTSQTPMQPHTPFISAPERWVRYWVLFEYGMDTKSIADYNGGPLPDGWTDQKGTLMSMWVADENREAVQVYNRLQVTLWTPGIRKFWIEINTSTNEVKANRGPMTAYFRNIAILKDVAYDAMKPLLQRPVTATEPAPLPPDPLPPDPIPPDPLPPDPDIQADVVINLNDTRQAIDGFGASSYANQFPADVIKNADLLFDKDKGVGLSLMRMGLPHNPDTGGRPYRDPEIAVLSQARGAKVWASNFYPPAKWKSNGIPTSGGTLLPQHYQDYADLLADEIQALRSDHGINMVALSIQNEPDKSQTWGSCLFSDAQFQAFLPVLYNEFQSRGMTTRIMMPEMSSWRFTRADGTMANPTLAAMVGILAAHRYSSPDGWASPYKDSKPVWQTEHSIGSDTAHSISTALTQAVEIHNFMVQSEANAWHAWNLGVIMGGKRLYTLGNWSKFVRPGWSRVTTTQASDVLTSAFAHTSGDFAIVMINTFGSSRTRTVGIRGADQTSLERWVTSSSLNLEQQPNVSVSGGVFTAVLPAQSVTTFVGEAR